MIFIDMEEILNAYKKGQYFNKESKIREHLPICEDGVSKLSINYMRQLREQVDNFGKLLQLESIVAELLKSSGLAQYGEIRNIYSLMQSQGNIIRKTNELVSALKQYKIRYADIKQAIEQQINTNDDIYTRNKKLMNKLYSDFGLTELDDKIKELTGDNLSDSIIKFYEEKNLPVGYYTNKELYDTAKQEYLDYITNLTNEHGLDLFKQISDSVSRHRENHDIYVKNIKNKLKDINKENSLKQQQDLIKRDSAVVMNNIEKALLNSNDPTLDSTRKFYDRLKAMGSEAYYIAIAGTSIVRYISKESRVTQYDYNMKLYKTEAEAQADADKLHDYILEKAGVKSYIEVQRLLFRTGKEDSVCNLKGVPREGLSPKAKAALQEKYRKDLVNLLKELGRLDMICLYSELYHRILVNIYKTQGEQQVNNRLDEKYTKIKVNVIARYINEETKFLNQEGKFSEIKGIEQLKVFLSSKSANEVVTRLEKKYKDDIQVVELKLNMTDFVNECLYNYRDNALDKLLDINTTKGKPKIQRIESNKKFLNNLYQNGLQQIYVLRCCKYNGIDEYIVKFGNTDETYTDDIRKAMIFNNFNEAYTHYINIKASMRKQGIMTIYRLDNLVDLYRMYEIQ